MPQAPWIVAAWSDAGRVTIYNISAELAGLGVKADMATVPGVGSVPRKPGSNQPAQIGSIQTHQNEGYALAWSPLIPGLLVSGDCDGKAFVHRLREGGFLEHVGVLTQPSGGSIEDVSFSPDNDRALVTASTDGSLTLFDLTAQAPGHAIPAAHDGDVNVVSWGPDSTLVSGGDDGVLRVWNLAIDPSKPQLELKYHRGPITHVEWCPTDPTMFSACSEDGLVTVWDITAESDGPLPLLGAQDNEELVAGAAGLEELPPQLLFEHLGLEDPKECHWHRQIPSFMVATGLSGLNLMQPANLIDDPNEAVPAAP
eukprot:gnl/Ergobibamus_cyprinoides/71.p1 GENE.gnl/Ergobibamus_cyprinoides/71~~gnl/Ergobibamus_cyprinoides/71.p1  ORF type:complete len:351 (+),score=76.82 gnl/Ergobibamus_cyprinoides/71:118-1053(+)